ncbi:MAG: polysaccharide deacetylase family protein [Clostridia bacterium]|nr:polysaccharide deacetylase family protein [Clostridia bacterium]
MKKTLIAGITGIILLALTALITLNIINSRTFQFFGGIVTRVHTEEKVIALTFDDGPTKKVDEILPILNAENVKATFFLIGNEIKQFPGEARKIALAGHEIGNHTYSHNRMVFKSLPYIKKEIENTDKIIREIGYNDTIHFRPPNGKKLILLPYYLKQNNRKTILWDLEPNTYPQINKSADTIATYVIDHAKPGSIILLHPMYDEKGNTIHSIKKIIKGLKSKGYTFKTVSELLKLQ